MSSPMRRFVLYGDERRSVPPFKIYQVIKERVPTSRHFHVDLRGGDSYVIHLATMTS